MVGWSRLAWTVFQQRDTKLLIKTINFFFILCLPITNSCFLFLVFVCSKVADVFVNDDCFAWYPRVFSLLFFAFVFLYESFMFLCNANKIADGPWPRTKCSSGEVNRAPPWLPHTFFPNDIWERVWIPNCRDEHRRRSTYTYFILWATQEKCYAAMSFFFLRVTGLVCSLLWNEIHQSVQNLEQERPIFHILLLPLHRTECLAILSLFILPSHTHIRTQLLAQLFLSRHQLPEWIKDMSLYYTLQAIGSGFIIFLQ